MNTISLTLALMLNLSCSAPASTPIGRRVDLGIEGATLFVPDGYRPSSGGAIDVVMHLHGASPWSSRPWSTPGGRPC